MDLEAWFHIILSCNAASSAPSAALLSPGSCMQGVPQIIAPSSLSSSSSLSLCTQKKPMVQDCPKRKSPVVRSFTCLEQCHICVSISGVSVKASGVWKSEGSTSGTSSPEREGRMLADAFMAFNSRINDSYSSPSLCISGSLLIFCFPNSHTLIFCFPKSHTCTPQCKLPYQPGWHPLQGLCNLQQKS